jgi:hypothetical protein
MSILTQLSSQTGDRSEGSNHKVVIQCLEHPELLTEIAGGLTEKNAALAGDCAEVMTQVAEQRPDYVAPYARALSELLAHKATRVRWEAMHALALTATSTPATITGLLPTLAGMIRDDPSIIVRDYATDAASNYASSGKMAAENAFPLLKEALAVWNGRHAGHALKGLVHVAKLAPAHQAEINLIGQKYSEEGRAVVRKQAKELLKAIQTQ